MKALWPAKTAIIGVYDEPPDPDQDVIDAIVIDTEEINQDFLNRELLKTARKLTEIKDWLGGLTG